MYQIIYCVTQALFAKVYGTIVKRVIEKQPCSITYRTLAFSVVNFITLTVSKTGTVGGQIRTSYCKCFEYHTLNH